MWNRSNKDMQNPKTPDLKPCEQKSGDLQKFAWGKKEASDRPIRLRHSFKKIKLGIEPMSLFTRRSLVVFAITLLLTGVVIFALLPFFGTGASQYKPWSGARISVVEESLNSLAIALGRYRFHVGVYPTTEEGLEVLAPLRKKDRDFMRSSRPGWDGPYINHLRRDQWGMKYVYECRSDGGHPVLYSCGPDRQAGTPDDIFPMQDAFDQAFRDTSWTNHWVPAEYRHIYYYPHK